jgi:hypothetical protein
MVTITPLGTILSHPKTEPDSGEVEAEQGLYSTSTTFLS